MAIADAKISPLGKALGDYIVARLALVLVNQGHNLTGDLIKSLEHTTRSIAGGIQIEFTGLEYAYSLNYGVTAARIPYREGSGAKTSKFIQGLTRYVERRMGLQGKEAVSVAFAIAKKQKKFGSPLSGKIGFIDITLETEKDKIDQIIVDFVGREIEFVITQYLKVAK